MTQELRQIQLKAGAIFEADTTVPQSFGNDKEALKAALEGVALCDRLHWGMLKLSGEDCLRYLHNQSTNNISRLKPGQGCDTVFVTSTGRTIDLTTVYVIEDGVLVLVSPNRRLQLMEWMDRYIFPMDRVELKDISSENALLTLMGPQSDRLLKQLGVEEILHSPQSSHLLAKIGDLNLRVAVGSGLALPGYTLILPIDKATEIWKKIIELGAIPLGDRVWEQLRILQGRPAPDRELTEDYNPLEAGLIEAISFDKGCYIGQETIARLNTYKGVKQRLWGVQLEAFVSADTEVRFQGDKVGRLTSSTLTEQGAFGLAYIRTKAGGTGLKVEIGNTSGELVNLPFLSYEYYQPEKRAENGEDQLNLG
jgi:tRNA-modifying protein YgfZ